MSDEQPKGTRWSQIAGERSGEEYAARFAALAAEGRDMHGEATFCANRLPAGGRLLDAGCGTGRVAVQLAGAGFDVVGVDVDRSMLDVARRSGAPVRWVLSDLAALDLATEDPFDVVVLAGNVVPLLAEGTLPAAVDALVATVAPRGLLVAGFGLDRAHLPPGCPVTPLAEYDEACTGHGFAVEERYSTWDEAPFVYGETGYAVSVHRRHAE